MTRDYYILENDQIKAVDLMTWALWFESARNRIVKQEMVGDCKVSTVFLGLDHNFSDDGSPVLWETMVFGGKLDQETDRCSGGKEQAEAMHEAMVKRVKE